MGFGRGFPVPSLSQGISICPCSPIRCQASYPGIMPPPLPPVPECLADPRMHAAWTWHGARTAEESPHPALQVNRGDQLTTTPACYTPRSPAPPLTHAVHAPGCVPQGSRRGGFPAAQGHATPQSPQEGHVPPGHQASTLHSTPSHLHTVTIILNLKNFQTPILDCDNYTLSSSIQAVLQHLFQRICRPQDHFPSGYPINHSSIQTMDSGNAVPNIHQMIIYGHECNATFVSIPGSDGPSKLGPALTGTRPTSPCAM